MVEPRVVLLVGCLLLTAPQLCACMGFSVELIHRDSPLSPFHDPTLTSHDRMHAAARRSLSAAATDDDHGVDSEVTPVRFDYVMAINIGTPPTRMLAVVDTGTDLTWVNCAANLTSTPGAVFDWNASSSWAPVACHLDECTALQGSSCDGGSLCRYDHGYADGSRTGGLLSTETLTFGGHPSRERPLVRMDNIAFGCSKERAGRVPGDGVVGLGGGPLSLLSQLGAKLSPPGRRFSYCLTPSSNSSSVIRFGDRAAVSEPGAVTTPLVGDPHDMLYTIAVDSVGVGGREVLTRSTCVAVDSGTSLSYLDPAIVRLLVAELNRTVDKSLPRASISEDGVCFQLSGTPGEAEYFPNVTLVLGGGGQLTLPADNVFYVAGNLKCLAVLPISFDQPTSILGNNAQQNLHVGFDVDARTVTFAPADCAGSS